MSSKDKTIKEKASEVLSDSSLITEERTLVAPIDRVDTIEVGRSPALLMIAGAQIGRSVLIDKDEFMVGRAETSDLVVEDDLVSRHHCKITSIGQNAEIADLASTNGTFLNGKKIDRAALKEGDQIQVGKGSIFKYHLQEEVEAKFLNDLFNAATKDFLTHTYNKKYFIELLQHEFFYAQRHSRPLSVLILDIDFFKKVNDTFGHLAGDIAIQKLAHFLLSHTRKDDIVARFGGEEFVILMRDCDLDQAQVLAENLRKGVSELVIPAGQKVFRITASLGVATLNPSTQAQIVRFENLLERADTQLYRAKTSGRNRVCL